MTAAISKTVLLADIGGTHCRLALVTNGVLGLVKTYKTLAWENLESVVNDFLQTAPNCPVYFLLSFGIKASQDGWYSLDNAYKDAPWKFHPDKICAATGIPTMRVVHDFAAMGQAVLHGGDAFKPLHAAAGVADAKLSLIVGAGSGVGHAYVDKRAERVYDTHGAHMPPVVVNAEQAALLPIIQNLRGGERTLIAEDILGGAALLRFHAALCSLNDTPNTITTHAEFMDAATVGDKTALHTINSWGFWLGCYCNALVTGAYAYAGIYLCGGVVENMLRADVFASKKFLDGFHLNMVRVVDTALRATPIYIPATDHTAFFGLLDMCDAA